jgi:hypothetical protein
MMMFLMYYTTQKWRLIMIQKQAFCNVKVHENCWIKKINKMLITGWLGLYKFEREGVNNIIQCITLTMYMILLFSCFFLIDLNGISCFGSFQNKYIFTFLLKLNCKICYIWKHLSRMKLLMCKHLSYFVQIKARRQHYAY